MSTEKFDFEKCLLSCSDLSSIYSFLTKGQSELNADSILRAEFVLLVSSFDNYIHQVVTRKLVDLFFLGTVSCTENLISLTDFQRIYQETNQTNKEQLLFSAITKRLSKDSFQSPQSIDYALGLIGIRHIWSTISPLFPLTSEQLRTTLSLIVLRRNQIAHEADIDKMTGQYRNIDIQTVEDCKEFLTKFVSAIDSLI